MEQQARAYLRAYGRDGTAAEATDPVKAANDLAYEIEVKRMQHEIRTGRYEATTGDKNCDGGKDCSWDGESRRCQCGNRRMYWETWDDHSFLKPSIYARPD